MITEFDSSKRIRRGSNNFKITKEKNKFKKFSDYGLNVYKNFLSGGILNITDDKDLFEYTSTCMEAVFEDAESVAIFCVKKNNTKIVYILESDYYFDPEEGIAETEPIVEVAKIEDDIYDQAFAVFDARHNFDVYGLLIEMENGLWISLDT